MLTFGWRGDCHTASKIAPCEAVNGGDMIDDLWPFLSAILVLMILPGADMAYMIANGVAYGRRGAAMAALGLSMGGLFMAFLLWAVLSFATSLSPDALLYIQYVGACYLLYLACQLLRPVPTTEEATSPAIPPLRTLLVRGMLTNISNPKVSVFFFAFIPPFIPSDAGDPALYALGLGVLLCVIGGAINFIYGLMGGAVQRVISPKSIKGRPISHIILASLFAIISFSILFYRLF